MLLCPHFKSSKKNDGCDKRAEELLKGTLKPQPSSSSLIIHNAVIHVNYLSKQILLRSIIHHNTLIHINHPSQLSHICQSFIVTFVSIPSRHSQPCQLSIMTFLSSILELKPIIHLNIHVNYLPKHFYSSQSVIYHNTYITGTVTHQT